MSTCPFADVRRDLRPDLSGAGLGRDAHRFAVPDPERCRIVGMDGERAPPLALEPRRVAHERIGDIPGVAACIQDERVLAVRRQGRALRFGVNPLQRLFQLGDVEMDLSVRRAEFLHVRFQDRVSRSRSPRGARAIGYK